MTQYNDSEYIMLGTVSNYLTDSLTPSEYDRQFIERMGWTDLIPKPDRWASKYNASTINKDAIASNITLRNII